MKHVAILIFLTFSSVVCSGEVTSTAESQLTGKSPDEQNYSRPYIVYFLGGTIKVSFMHGFGVVVNNGQILAHKNVRNHSEIHIYFPHNAQRLPFKTVHIFKKVHLLQPYYQTAFMVTSKPPSAEVYSDVIPSCAQTRTLIWKKAEQDGHMMIVKKDEKNGAFLTKNRFIIVGEKANDLDAIGDPLFIGDFLVGFRIEKTNEGNKAKYQDLDDYLEYLVHNQTGSSA